MPIDFPNSPTSGDTYSEGTKTWQYNGTSWDLVLGSVSIPSGSVDSAQLASDAVTTAKIASNAVTQAKLASGAVTEVAIASDAVTEAKISSNAVTQAKLADRAVGSAELDNLTLNAQTGTSYTFVLTDAHKLVTLSNASEITLTIPTNSSVAFDIGDQVNIVQLGAGQVTVGGAGVTLRSQGSKFKLNGIYSAATLIKIDTDEWVLVGNTAA